MSLPLPTSPRPSAIRGLASALVAGILIWTPQDALGQVCTGSFASAGETTLQMVMSRSTDSYGYLLGAGRNLERPLSFSVRAGEVNVEHVSSNTRVARGDMSYEFVSGGSSACIVTGSAFSTSTVTMRSRIDGIIITSGTEDPEPSLSGDQERLTTSELAIPFGLAIGHSIRTSDATALLPSFGFGLVYLRHKESFSSAFVRKEQETQLYARGGAALALGPMFLGVDAYLQSTGPLSGFTLRAFDDSRVVFGLAGGVRF